MLSSPSPIIYQLFLRAFTPQGTFVSAKKLIPHIASLGVDIIYLCPVALADDGPDLSRFSERQMKSGFGNPKNPYRIKDYYTIDPEYGTDAELAGFIDEAHRLGMRVILDLVYFHCGPSAVFIADHPDYVMRGADGSVIDGQWHFPRLNFECADLRRYLIDNMLWLVSDIGCDGFRCDVGDGVPVDFWEQARNEVSAVKPDIFMLNEGSKPEMMKKAFDACYGFGWQFVIHKIAEGEKKASKIAEHIEGERARLPEPDMIGCELRNYDNHDIANDDYDDRFEKRVGPRCAEALTVLDFTVPGIPFIYNGNEIGDTARHSIFASREKGGSCVIDWSSALTDGGRRRMEIIKKLSALRRELPSLSMGDIAFIENDRPDEVISFVREYDAGIGSGLIRSAEEPDSSSVVINMSDRPLTVNIVSESDFDAVYIESGTQRSFNGKTLRIDMLPWGYIAGRM